MYGTKGKRREGNIVDRTFFTLIKYNLHHYIVSHYIYASRKIKPLFLIKNRMYTAQRITESLSNCTKLSNFGLQMVLDSSLEKIKPTLRKSLYTYIAIYSFNTVISFDSLRLA